MIQSLDHVVLTVRDLDTTVRFYVEGLGMELREFDEGRKVLHFGDQKITCTSPATSSSPRRRIRCRARPICAF
jgi:catechol 2,3-dioxygenase-like lactoylglutathione lyase family enzyme